MARLLLKNAQGEPQVFDLRLGLNRVGRDPESDLYINRPNVSLHHANIILSADAIILEDCASTNGTFVNGDPIKQKTLMAGQTIHFGDVEVFVESIDVTIAIPHVEREVPKPPVVLVDGTVLCKRHTESRVTYRCTHCKEHMCAACVHVLRRKGGKTLRLCPLCSNPVELIEAPKPKKKTLIDVLKSTVQIPFRKKKVPAEEE